MKMNEKRIRMKPIAKFPALSFSLDMHNLLIYVNKSSQNPFSRYDYMKDVEKNK